MNKYLTKIAAKLKAQSTQEKKQLAKPGKKKGTSLVGLTMKPKSVIMKKDNLVKAKKKK